MSGLNELTWWVTAGLLTYLAYSTLIVGAAWGVSRTNWLKRPEFRLRLWRTAALSPLVLTAASMLLPAPSWLPIFELRPATVASAAPRSSQSVDSATHARRPSTRPPANETRRLTAPAAVTADRPNLPSHRTEMAPPEPNRVWKNIALIGVACWIAGVALGLARVLLQVRRLRQWVSSGESLEPHIPARQWAQFCRAGGVACSTQLLGSRQLASPLAGGWWRPFVIVPLPWFHELETRSQHAILAHELAHIRHRDAWWNLLLQLNGRVCFFQPLIAWAVRQARMESEYVADREAARTVDHPTDLARSLIELAERLLPGGDRASKRVELASRMTLKDDDLPRRIASVLESTALHRLPRWQACVLTVTIIFCPTASLLALPRIQTTPVDPSSLEETNPMKSVAATIGLVTGLWFSSPAALPAQDQDAQQSADQRKEVIAVPEELQQFSGMMIGKLVDRDIERGSFTVTVDYVARVWENNKARNPRSAVGQTLRVEGITGKWLDQLLLIRAGDSIEFEAQHREGNSLRFPGEWLKKVAPYDPADHPVPPHGFRGFSGTVIGKIEAKRQESRELVLTIQDIKQTFENNRADEPGEVKGQKIVLAGFWARMSEPFDELKEGDTIHAGIFHRVPQSDHFTVAEFAEKVSPDDHGDSAGSDRASASDGPIPAGMRGFRGILRGTLVSRDVEKGTLEFRAHKATRVWKASRAANLDSCEGVTFVVKGISGKWLDVLLTLEPGDTIDVEAFHNGQDHLDFIQEYLQKVE